MVSIDLSWYLSLLGDTTLQADLLIPNGLPVSVVPVSVVPVAGFLFVVAKRAKFQLPEFCVVQKIEGETRRPRCMGPAGGTQPESDTNYIDIYICMYICLYGCDTR